MSVVVAVFLGAIQGLTEFLPVSSSGHLVLSKWLLGVTPSFTFDVAVHFGTLFAILVALRKEVRLIFDGLLPGNRRATKEGRHLLLLLIVGTIPAGIVGLLFKDAIEGFFASVYTSGFMLLITGTMLFFATKLASGSVKLGQIKVSDALIIGAGQALAVLPGLSRSGTTLSAGLLRGIDREAAARFAFLLAVPAIAGAAVLELPEVLSGEIDVSGGAILAGTATAAFTGYLAIRLLLEVIKRRGLVVFSYYTWFVGVVVLLGAYFLEA